MSVKRKNPTPTAGDLRVWWIPQVPGKPFYVPVKTTDEASLVLVTLAEYDLFQLAQHIKPDFSNVGGLHVYEDGEWVDWCDEDTGDDLDTSNVRPEITRANR